MFVCIHYNRNATQIKKYVDMNIFKYFVYNDTTKFSLSIDIMEADAKIFLNLLQFITTIFTILLCIMLLYIMLPIYIYIYI